MKTNVVSLNVRRALRSKVVIVHGISQDALNRLNEAGFTVIIKNGTITKGKN